MTRLRRMGKPLEQRRTAGKPPLLLAAAILFLYLFSTWASRNYYLDDAFIHLRYAENFLRTGTFYFNEGQLSFGASAPLYMMAISATGSLFFREHWPFLVKSAGIIFHLAGIILILWYAFSATGSDCFGRRVSMIAGLGLMLASPATARWLLDGMETALGLFCAAGTAAAGSRWFVMKSRPRAPEVIATVVVFSVTCCLRIDFIIYTLVATALVLLNRRPARTLVLILSILISICFYIWIFHTTGSIDPESALAKRLGGPDPGWIIDFGIAMAAVSPFWLVGAVLLIILGARQGLPSRQRVFLLSGAVPIAAVVCWGVLTGQKVQGARYFVPAFGFAWIFLLRSLTLLDIRKVDTFQLKSVQMIVLAALILSCVHVAVIYKPLSRVLHEHAFHLPERLKGPDRLIGARDVGLIGWYSGARMLDLVGLVNGR